MRLGKNVVIIFAVTVLTILLGTQIAKADPPYLFWPTRADFEVSYGPKSTTSADFNNDGTQDVAVCYSSSNYFSILLGNGNGQLTNIGNTSGVISAASIISADFNNDSNIDIAVLGSNYVYFFVGDGTGVFTSAGNLSIGTFTPISLTSADFNNDGNHDLAVLLSGQLKIFLGNGNFLFFSVGSTYFPGQQAKAIIRDDFNNDGNLDLVVANSGTSGNGDVRILLGTGSGLFSAPVIYATGGATLSIVAHDFNNDAHCDLACANSSNISVLFGDGFGSFGTPTTYSVGTSGFNSITTADFNRDGNYDLAAIHTYIGSTSYGRVYIFLGDDTGSFMNTANYAAGNWPRSIVSTDVNNDNNYDLVFLSMPESSEPSNGYCTVLLGSETGIFSEAPNFASGTNNYSNVLATADFNNDGNNDLAVGTYDPGGVSILLGDGNRNFEQISSFALATWPKSIATADLNNDNNQDLVVTHSSWPTVGSISVFLGNGEGIFTEFESYIVNYSTSVTIANFNDDDYNDLAVANTYTDSISILLGARTGFSAPINYDVGDSPEQLVVADFNNDGDLDLATANYYSHNVSILLGDGTGVFLGPENYSVGNLWPISITSADFNNDGNMDLAVGNYIYNSFCKISILFGDGTGFFSTPINYDVVREPRSIITLDFNNDANYDLATANNYSDNISILLGTELGIFSEAINYGITGDKPVCLVSADFDNDGRRDLASANLYSNNVSLLFNNYSPVYVNSIPNLTAVPQGGVLEVTMRFINETAQPQTFQLRGIVTLPNGHEKTVLNQRNITVPANQILEQQTNLNIPLTAPLDTYLFTAYIGTAQDDIWDSDSFNFTVVEPGLPNYPVYNSIPGKPDLIAVWE